MVSNKLTSWFGSRKKAERFEIQITHEQSRGYLVEVASDRSWYISFGLMTSEELADSPGWVMRLYSMHDGMVCEARLVHYKNDRVILIGDIEAHVENRGYGSIMLSNILNLAYKLNIQEIKGNLTAADSDHFDKLEHFYKKHGFEVKFFEGKASGRILLRTP